MAPTLITIKVDAAQPFSPKLASQKLPDGTMISPRLENMWPFLSNTEILKNKLILVVPQLMKNLVFELLEDSPAVSTGYLAENFFANNKDSVIIYGSGEGLIPLTRTILQPLSITPHIIVDQRYTTPYNENDTLYLNFDQLLLQDLAIRSYPLVVTIGSRKIAGSIIQSLTMQGFTRVIWAPDLYEYSLHHSVSTIFQLRDQCVKQSIEIDQAYMALSDHTSATLFRSILTRYLTAQPDPIPSLPFIDQYIGSDLPINPNIRLTCVVGHTMVIR